MKTVINILGIIALLSSVFIILINGFENLFLTGVGITFFCLSNAMFRLALKEEYLETDALVCALAQIHHKEIEKFLEEKQKEIKEKKKK